MKNVWQMLKQVYADWSDHEAPRLGAALAFYAVLSLAPLLILVIAMVSLVFARSTAQNQILEQVRSMIGESGAATVRTMIEHAQKPSSGIFASTIALITLLFGASGVFTELRSGLNKLWDVRTPTGSGIAGMIRERLLSFGMVLALGFLMLVSLIMNAALAALEPHLGGATLLNFLISLAGITLMFALIVKYMPDTKSIGGRRGPERLQLQFCLP